MKLKVIFVLAILPFAAFAQNTSLEIIKDKSSYVFGQIYAGFRYGFNPDFKPQAAFDFNQGIIGYVHQLSEKLSGKILYDVTRTTHIYEITDTSGNQLNYAYFEGSKYTAYLKMAEIKWDINQYFTFRVGQLLTTQYLTFIDRFWGYRYVDVTFQEKFGLGMPADFGAQLDFKIKDKFVNQFSIVNGEGPFRYQDINSKFIYSNNIQFYPTEKITLKLYTDYGPASDTGTNAAPKSVISGFAGYKTDRFRIGAEYTYVFNYGFVKDINYYGLSVFGSVVINDKFQALARYDNLNLEIPVNFENTNYYIVGFQYEPVNKFTTSLNFRYYSADDLPFIYANFGLKF
jgi:hypothetical protein